MLPTTQAQIDKNLQRFLTNAKKRFRMDLIHPILFDSIEEFILRKGKRIRPTLMVFSYKGYCASQEHISPSIHYVSSCIELLHNFMLIHDDIIDRSDLRRGKPTLHKILRNAARTKDRDKLGSDLGIVAGDIVYALAIDAFLSVKAPPKRKEKALKYFIKTAVFTAMGEFIDTLYGMDKIEKINEKDVLLNYTLKTAHYTFDCPLVVGAILAGAPPKDVHRLSQFGLLMGQAFQIQDDIIGIFEHQKNIGKSILSDIEEGKKTILVCHAYHHLKGRQKKSFLSHFSKNHKTYADLKEIKKIFISCGSLGYSLDAIKIRLDLAEKILYSLSMKPRYVTEIKKSLFKLFAPCDKIARQHQIIFKNNWISN